LVKEIEQLEQLFTVDTAKLKEITDHFQGELTKGVSYQYLVNYGLFI
jgi:hexokinase